MKRVIFVCGAISGVVTIGSMILGLTMAGDGGGAGSSQWLGYLIMIVALSLIFLGIKRYRDQELGGVIRFGTAMLLGLGITLVASLIYVAVWEVHLAITDYAFIEDYAQSVLANKEAGGLTGAALETEVASMETFKTRYANPLFRLPMTFLEIFPVGLIISLISAGLLKNDKFAPA